MGDSEDDWLFHSIKIYKHLLMYDLQKAATSLSWSSDQSVCVVSSRGDNSELLELSLPGKILLTEESQGLCSDRDFRVVCGGFADPALKEVKCIPNTRLAAVSEKDKNSLSIWSLGSSDSDLIVQESIVENSVKQSCSASLDVTSSSIIFGSTIDDICLVDLQTNKVIQDCSGVLSDHPKNRICKLFMKNEHDVLACSQETCEFWRFDSREGFDKRSHQRPRGITPDGAWTYDVIFNKSETETVVSLESCGQMAAFDWRNLEEPLKTRNLTGFKNPVNEDTELLTLKVSPTNSEVLSVSGLDGCVHLFNTASLDKGDNLHPEFSHGGHMACCDQSETVVVSTHTWHPWQPDLILSSATDGSLHGWQRERKQ